MPLDFANYQPEDKILSTLIRADELLSGPEVWWRGEVGGPGDNCVVTATRFAKHTVRIKAMKYLQAAVPNGYNLIGDYNDDPSTTFTDIKSLFARAIEKRRAEVLVSV